MIHKLPLQEMKAWSCFLGFLLITFFSAAHSYTVYRENGKVGLKNDDGVILIPAQFDGLGWSNGTFSVVNNVTGYFSNNRWGVITLDNHFVTKAQFEELIPGDGSLLIARKKATQSLRVATGCIHTSGKEVIPFLYDGIKMSAFRAIVYTKIGNQFKYGLIDLENKTLIPQQYQHIRSIGTLRYAVLNFEGKTALFTENGKQITGFTIDSLSSFKNNFAILYQGTEKGLIDREGRLKLEPKFRDIILEENGTVKVREADEWIFLEGNSKWIKNTRADSVVAVGKNLLKVENSKLIQLTDSQLKPITQTTFSTIGKFENGKALYRWDNHYGIVLMDGSVLVPPLYDQLISDKNFILARQRIAGKPSWLLLDTLGERRTNKTYETILPFNGKFFTVQHRSFWGVINQRGEEVIACTYDSLLQIKDNLVVVKFHGQYGIINLKEEWITPPKKNKLKLLGNDRYLEFTLPTTLLKSLDGRIIYFSDNKLEPFADHLLEYLSSGTIWKINFHGVIIDRQVFPAETTEKVFEESEGLRAIKRNGKYGFIDSQGRLRIANRYEAVQKFSEGFAAVKILNKWGFINKHDNIAVQPVYEEVFPFRGGFALVKQKGFFGLIDTKGKLVLPVRYEKIEALSSKNFLIQQDKLLGLADENGKTVIHCKYNTLTDLANGYVIASRDGKYGVITQQGLSTVPLIYDYIMYDPYNDVFLAQKAAPWTEIKL